MNSRKKALLRQIIKEHIKTASPVGSKLIEAKSRLGVSSATIRNEMAALEKEGYIIQPHTSAGRIPTEKGYQFILNELPKRGKISSNEKKVLIKMAKNSLTGSADETVKALAKKMSDFSSNAVIAAFSKNDIFYTGLSNLFSQPEFQNTEYVYNMSLIIDHLDKAINKIYDEISQVTVHIGSDNPFGRDCSVVLGPWKVKNKSGIMGILGPIRMDYEKNIGLINFLSE